MKILVACEYSGRVRDAFLKKGHDVMSCDLLPTESPGPHYQGDVFDVIHDGWDMMIAHPPCTYLTVSGNRSFLNNPERWKQRLDAMLFVHALFNADIEKICIENPQGVISTHIRPPDQYIQPYEFRYPESEKTGLWLKNLPLLLPTKPVKPLWINTADGKRHSPTHARIKDAKIRSLTYQVIADAMADQWDSAGEYVFPVVPERRPEQGKLFA
ncbi:hypothetical protein [Desulfobacter vibrioformis]|uniref:hypothetical protein n=1 Tax=Desulfobacter vibrioformis TaxID=34031 RepID=UPI000690DE01|nr:hypothetical protein [Desulfobacter vibrioformis]